MIKFDALLKDFEAKKKTLPGRVGNLMKNHVLTNFERQGFVDAALDPWEARKNKTTADRRYIKRTKSKDVNAGRALLVDTGALKGSIAVGVATFDKIEVGTYGITYGVYHNRGEGVQPKRKFMGSSKSLSLQISKLIRSEVNSFLGKK